MIKEKLLIADNFENPACFEGVKGKIRKKRQNAG